MTTAVLAWIADPRNDQRTLTAVKATFAAGIVLLAVGLRMTKGA